MSLSETVILKLFLPGEVVSGNFRQDLLTIQVIDI